MEKIYECFENIGVFIPDEEKNSDLFLEEYIQDSLQYINLILTIERVFNISLSDEALAISHINKLSELENLVLEALKK